VLTRSTNCACCKGGRDGLSKICRELQLYQFDELAIVTTKSGSSREPVHCQFNSWFNLVELIKIV
jgi:hypothetical protein